MHYSSNNSQTPPVSLPPSPPLIYNHALVSTSKSDTMKSKRFHTSVCNRIMPPPLQHFAIANYPTPPSRLLFNQSKNTPRQAGWYQLNANVFVLHTSHCHCAKCVDFKLLFPSSGMLQNNRKLCFRNCAILRHTPFCITHCSYFQVFKSIFGPDLVPDLKYSFEEN